MKNVYVTQSFLPKWEEYTDILKQIWERKALTNQGVVLQEFESLMRSYLNVDYFQYVNNGTIALQLALNALEITEGEVITTPFSYVATISSILWERCKPVFVDIEADNFTIDVHKIEQAITPNTKAIMAVHVFGYACDVFSIEKLAEKYNLKVIYDAAHAFGSVYHGKSLLAYGDISTVSFHATKLFHTVEGGACIIKDESVHKRLDLAKRFGHYGDDHYALGINAKASEFHAAMGVANFPYIDEIIQKRKEISDYYDSYLKGKMQRPALQNGLEYNYAYYPIIFETEKQLQEVFEKLNKENIYPRRYFYPSLNKLPYVTGEACPVSEDIALRSACLPLYVDLEKNDLFKIINILK